MTQEQEEFREMLTFVEDLGLMKVGKNRKRFGMYKCSCGNMSKVITSAVKSGRITKCKECAIRTIALKNTKHGDTDTRLHRVWLNMRSRCNNPNVAAYSRYGGRGLEVCDEWNDSYIKFSKWAKDNGYTDNLEIDRTNNEEGYSPNNCGFVTRKENMCNQSKSISNRFTEDELSEICEMPDRGFTIPEVVEATGISRASIQRMRRGEYNG